MGTRSLFSVLVLGLALMLVGCQLRADVDVRLDADGGGVFALALEVDEALDAEARAAGLSFPEFVADATADLDGWDVESAGRRVTLSTEVDGPEELSATTTALADALEGPELRPLEPFDVTVTEDRVRVESGAGLEVAPAVAEMGFEADEAVDVLREGLVYRVTVEMPGDVLEHNADRSDGERLTWEVPSGSRITILAEAERPQESPLPLLAAAGAAAVAVLVLLAAFGRRRRRGGRRGTFSV